jgi:hypothetical protein
MTLDYARQFKLLGDRLAGERITARRFVRAVLAPLFRVEQGMSPPACAQRAQATAVLASSAPADQQAT